MKQFKEYPYNKNYIVYRDGRILSKPKPGNGYTERFLKIHTNADGYAKIKLYPEKKTISVHRMVAITFIRNPHNKPQINHKDGNKLNNCVTNLEWCTNDENFKHATDNGLRPNEKRPRGINHKRAKISEQDVIDIRNRYIKADFVHGGAAIGREYGLDTSTVCDIVNRVIWQHIP